ncbi:hypothetical protein [Arthrobacter sp.]|uniref:hypothetical protein n=1 Tax=Arthrobacter sp. TaxID=1667 RepID=UPI003A90FEBD
MLERAGHATFDYTLHDGAAPVRIQHHFVDELGLAVNIQTWELPVGGSGECTAMTADNRCRSSTRSSAAGPHAPAGAAIPAGPR